MSDDTIIRGNSARWYHSLTDANGNPVNLTGFTVWFTVKPESDLLEDDPTDANAVIKHHIAISGAGAVTSSDGFAVGGIDYNQSPPVVVSGVSSGVLTQTLEPEDSTTLALGTYVYDVQAEDATGFIDTPIIGLTLTVLPDVTRRTSTP